MYKKCDTSPDWEGYGQASEDLQSSIEPKQFFGCNPYGNAAAIEALYAQQRQGDEGQGPVGVQVCNRKVDGWLGVGNHTYLWDNRTGESCGRGPNNGKEDGPTQDDCMPVSGSVGHEDEIMALCSELRDDGIFFPGINDCHTTVDSTLERAGVPSVDVPRFGKPGRFLKNGKWSDMPAVGE